MFSYEPGVYTAEGQPPIIVTYGGEIAGDEKHTGPWVQWRFPWDTDVISTICFEFGNMVKQAGYRLTEPKPSEGFYSGLKK